MSLKADLKQDALKRDQSFIKLTYWSKGEPLHPQALGMFLAFSSIPGQAKKITVSSLRRLWVYRQ
ncbi:hypothetical protein RR46_08312 [Papilio xuthus]|uniref:Uncharacterized protein n=1 Tax=Papilio xuthus TaxID=66420 RepID=A0A194PEU5_PAPXU|nr:hypothetical protein RR46_08312 [Papilio xuthus]